MMTNLTLDDDVAAMLERLRKTRGESLKHLINEALRKGLQQLETPQEKRGASRTEAVDLGACRLENLDNVAEILAKIEGEACR